MDKEIIIRNFSRYAHTYDKYADAQKWAALKLLGRIKENNFSNILEIGCGTGNYTKLLKDKFRKAKLTALDISRDMVGIAQNKLRGEKIEFIVADAECIELKDKFDFVTSNSCFQWFSDLEKALIKYADFLREGGVISFSIFGPLTFCELNVSLSHISKESSITANHFISKATIRVILKRIFGEFSITEARFEESFLSLNSLLNKIKYSGIRGNGVGNKKILTPRLLKKLEGVYLSKFNGIRATYQVFLCCAR